MGWSWFCGFLDPFILIPSENKKFELTAVCYCVNSSEAEDGDKHSPKLVGIVGAEDGE